jgi:hypothetical protein
VRSSGKISRKKSMSPEYVRKPCQETASAPTIKNSTLFERKHAINSRESFVSGIQETPLLDPEKDLNSLFGRHGPAFAIFSRRSYQTSFRLAIITRKPPKIRALP